MEEVLALRAETIVEALVLETELLVVFGPALRA